MTTVSGEPSVRPGAPSVNPVDITAEMPAVGEPPRAGVAGGAGGAGQVSGAGSAGRPGRPTPGNPGSYGLPGPPGFAGNPGTATNPAGPAGARPFGDPGTPDATEPPAPAVPAGVNHLGGATVAILVGAALAVTANHGAVQLLVAVAVMQGLLVISWVLGTGLPGRIGGLVVGGLAAAGADIVVSRWPHGQLGTLLGVLGLAIPAMFIHQLTRGVVRARVTESLSDIAVLVVAVVALPALVQLRHEVGGEQMVTVVVLAATGALLVGHLVDAVVPRPGFDPTVSRGLLAVVVAIGVGTAVAYLRLRNTIEFTAGRAAFLGAAVGGIVSLFAVGAAFVEQTSSAPSGPTRLLRPIFGILLPIGLISPVAYLLCLAIRG
jgi:hypothetical protein